MNTTTIVTTRRISSAAAGTSGRPNPQDEDNPNWIPVKALGKTADAVGKYLTKGNQVGVTGRIETSEWDDSDGQRHWKIEVLARTVDFLNTNNKSTSDTEEREEATV